MDRELVNIYGNKVRVRACGLVWRDNRLLMVNHASVTPTNFWAPPGGGVEFGQSITECLIKEFREETGLHVTPNQFLFGCEYIQKPIHSIELFYAASIDSGTLKRGQDPEIQIIREVRFMSPDEISQLPPEELHGIFRRVQSPDDLVGLRGFFRI